MNLPTTTPAPTTTAENTTLKIALARLAMEHQSLTVKRNLLEVDREGLEQKLHYLNEQILRLDGLIEKFIKSNDLSGWVNK